MLLTKSPIRVARMAFAVTTRQLSRYRTRFSRHDFRWPQLVACLLVREFFQLDYRGTELLLREFRELRRALCLRRVPDHTVFCRALGKLTSAEVDSLLDETVRRCQFGPERPVRRGCVKTVIPDSTRPPSLTSRRASWS